MGSQTHKSSLDDWLGRGTNIERLWKLIFFFFSRFILVFCLLHYLGEAYPQYGWTFPGPTSEEFWAFCVLFSAIFSTVFYVIRAKRKGSREEQKQILYLEEQKPIPYVEEQKHIPHKEQQKQIPYGNDRKKNKNKYKGEHPYAKDAEEKRESRHGRVSRAAFVAEPETSGPELEEERSEHEGDRRE